MLTRLQLHLALTVGALPLLLRHLYRLLRLVPGHAVDLPHAPHLAEQEA